MAYYPKKPKLTHEDVLKEINKRTCYNLDAIYKVLWVYNDIVKEAMMEQVEVPFGDIGFFSWKQITARHDVVTYNHSTHEYNEPGDVDGFRKQTFRVNAKWGKTLKEATRYSYGEEKPE